MTFMKAPDILIIPSYMLTSKVWYAALQDNNFWILAIIIMEVNSYKINAHPKH